MELDQATIDVLHGKVRDTEAHGADGANYRVITRVGRSKRYVPPFATNELQLRAVIQAVTLSYVFRNAKIPSGFGATLDNLQQAAADDWMATIAAIAYRAWLLRWHGKDIANSLAMTKPAVEGILYKLRRQAEVLGFEVNILLTVSGMKPKKTFLQRGPLAYQ